MKDKGREGEGVVAVDEKWTWSWDGEGDWARVLTESKELEV